MDNYVHYATRTLAALPACSERTLGIDGTRFLCTKACLWLVQLELGFIMPWRLETRPTNA